MLCVSVYLIDAESVRFPVHTAGSIFSGYFLSSGCLQLLPQSRRPSSDQKRRFAPLQMLAFPPSSTLKQQQMGTRMSVPWTLLPPGETALGSLCAIQELRGAGPSPPSRSLLFASCYTGWLLSPPHFTSWTRFPERLLTPKRLFQCLFWGNSTQNSVNLISVKHLMVGKTEGRKRRVQQRMRWLGGITDSVDVSLSEFQDIVKDWEVRCAAVHEVVKSRTWLGSRTTY